MQKVSGAETSAYSIDSCEPRKIYRVGAAIRKTLAAKLLQEHENLISAGNDNRVLFETMMIHEEEFVIASETKLESTLPSPLPWDTANSDVKSKEQEDSSQMIPEKKLKWMVTKLASTLMKLKAREINLSNEKSSLKKQVLDLQNVSDHAQNLSKAISKQKVELSGHLLSSRRDKLEKHCSHLTNQVVKLESDLQNSRHATQGLEQSVSEKDEEIHQLHSNIITKTGMIFDLRQQNEQFASDHADIANVLKSKYDSLKGLESDLQIEKEAAFALKLKLERMEDSQLELPTLQACVRALSTLWQAADIDTYRSIGRTDFWRFGD